MKLNVVLVKEKVGQLNITIQELLRKPASSASEYTSLCELLKISPTLRAKKRLYMLLKRSQGSQGISKHFSVPSPSPSALLSSLSRDSSIVGSEQELTEVETDTPQSSSGLSGPSAQVKTNTAKNSEGDPSVVRAAQVKTNTSKNSEGDLSVVRAAQVKTNTSKNSHGNAVSKETKTSNNSKDTEVPENSAQNALGSPSQGDSMTSDNLIAESLPSPHCEARSEIEVRSRFTLIHLGSCRIEERNWSLIWDGTSLLYRKYGGGLNSAFNVVVPGCSFISERPYPWKPNSKGQYFISVYGHCIHEACRRYRLIINPFEKPPTLDVYCDAIQTHHGTEPKWRPLNGPRRQKMYDIAEHLEPMALREKLILEADSVGLSQGNAQDIRPCSTYAQVRYEARARNDNHADPVFDVMLMRRAQVKKDYKGVQWIRHVGDPLTVVIFCEKRLDMFKSALKLFSSAPNGLTLHLDATGSVVRKVVLADSRIYYYAIVFKYMSNNQSHTIPLTEFVSSNHDARSVEEWLKKFAYFAETNGVSLGGHFLVLDCSFAGLNAVVSAFNNMDLYLFLQILHRFVTGTEPKKWVQRMRKIYVLPHLDYAHFKKQVADSLKEHYHSPSNVPNDGQSLPSSKNVKAEGSRMPPRSSGPVSNPPTIAEYKKGISTLKKASRLSPKEYKMVKSVLMDTFSLIAKTDSYGTISTLLHYLFTLLIFSVECDEVADSKKQLLAISEKFGHTSENSDLIDEEKCEGSPETPPLFFDVADHKIKYKTNPFYIDISKIFRNVIKFHHDFVSKHKKVVAKKNLFFNPPFAIHILTRYVHILPLWTALLLSKETSLNNGIVENYFGQTKNIFLNKMKNVRLNRFVLKMNDHVVSMHKQIEYNVPARKPRKTERKKRSLAGNVPIDEDAPSAKRARRKKKSANEEDSVDCSDIDCLVSEKRVDNMAPSLVYSLQTEDQWRKRGTMSVSPLGKSSLKFPHLKKHLSPKTSTTLSTSTRKPPTVNDSHPDESIEILPVNDSSPTEDLQAVQAVVQSENTDVIAENLSDEVRICASIPLAPLPARMESTRMGQEVVSTSNRENSTPIISTRCPNFRSALSALARGTSGFSDYISAITSTSKTVLDIYYYQPVRSLGGRKDDYGNLNYLVTCNDSCNYAHPKQEILYDDFSELNDFRRGDPAEKFWLGSTIIETVAKIFFRTYRTHDQHSVAFIPIDIGTKMFNNEWSNDDAFQIPLGAELLIMPYNVGQSHSQRTRGYHWCLVVVNLKLLQFCHLDPYTGKTTNPRQLLQLFLNCLPLSYSTSEAHNNWCFPEWTFPQQPRKDTHNCGVYVTWFTHCLLKSYPAPPSFSTTFCPDEYRKLLRYLLLLCSNDVSNNCFSCGSPYSADRGQRDAVWINCDICSRYIHLSDQCLNDKSLNTELMLQNARNRKVQYTCFLCKKISSSFRADQKILQIEELKSLYEKYLLR